MTAFSNYGGNIRPGAVVAVDSLHVGLLPGYTFYCITFIDYFTRMAYIHVTSSLTSSSAAQGLRAAQDYFPFPIHAVQTDGGSEFAKHFADACATAGSPHIPGSIAYTPIQYVTRPHTPKDNAIVERMQGIIRQEGLYYIPQHVWKIADIRTALMAWLTHYCTVRPHTALGYLTPQQALDKYNQSCQATPDSNMY